MLSKIRLHKKVNLKPITFGKESIINTFYSILQRYNKQHEYESLMIDRQELWEMAGFEGKYNSDHVFELIKNLTKSETYNLESIDPEIKSISGSMFIITSYSDGNIKINVPEDFRKYLFYKKDIDLMYKAKAKKKLTIQELDHYDKITKEKSRFLVLLKKADILGIKGKYNKRLYSLLGQFKNTGLYFTTWEKLKKVLEIPKSYKAGDIDQRIFNPAKEELLKAGIEITDIKKIKKGRSIDRVEIRFKCEEKRTPSVLQTSPPLDKDGENEVIEMSKIKRRALAELARKGKYHLIEPLMKLGTDEEVEEFMKKV